MRHLSTDEIAIRLDSELCFLKFILGRGKIMLQVFLPFACERLSHLQHYYLRTKVKPLQRTALSSGLLNATTVEVDLKSFLTRNVGDVRQSNCKRTGLLKATVQVH